MSNLDLLGFLQPLEILKEMILASRIYFHFVPDWLSGLVVKPIPEEVHSEQCLYCVVQEDEND